VGAGASAGLVPFGLDFLRGPLIDYLQGGGFPVEIPQQSEPLTRRIVQVFMGMDVDDRRSLLFPGRVFRPGTPDFLWEMSRRLPDLTQGWP
jgi:hypothetical protein